MQFPYFPDRKQILVTTLLLLFPAFVSECNITNPIPQYSTNPSYSSCSASAGSIPSFQGSETPVLSGHDCCCFRHSCRHAIPPTPYPSIQPRPSEEHCLEYMLHHTSYSAVQSRFPSISMQFLFQFFTDRMTIPVTTLLLLLPALMLECNNTNPIPQYSTTT